MDQHVRTGCDLQPVAEVAEALARFGARYLDRVYTATEQRCLATGGPGALAARFAAKEAVVKLIGTADGVDPRTVEIRTTAEGRPEVHLSGPIARAARERGVGRIDASLSHAGEFAIAVAVAGTGVPT